MCLMILIFGAIVAIPPLVFNAEWWVGVLAGVLAFAIPFVWGSLPFSDSAPITKLKRGDPRTQVFVDDLVGTMAASGNPGYASLASSASERYRAGDYQGADDKFRNLGNRVSRDANATSLIEAWKQTWRASRGRQPMRRIERKPLEPDTTPALLIDTPDNSSGTSVPGSDPRVAKADDDDAEEEDVEDEGDDEAMDEGLDGMPRPPADDPGMTLVSGVIDGLSIDDKWSVWEERGFTWWGGLHAQRVWSEPGYDDDGIDIYRVHARTEVVRDCRPSQDQLDKLTTLNGLNFMSALVYEPDTRVVAYHASAWVHEQSLEWMPSVFSTVTAMQAAMADAKGELLASIVGGKPATSAHPASGTRTIGDDMLGINHAVVVPAGKGPSLWAGAELADFTQQLKRNRYAVLVTGGSTGFSAEFPHPDGTTLLTASTTEPHPTLGSGLLLRLSLPGRVPGRPGAWANEMNLRELSAMNRSHFLGSWVVAHDTANFVAFVPNLVAFRPGLIQNLILPWVSRARWIAEGIRGDDWARPGRVAEARAAKLEAIRRTNQEYGAGGSP